MDLERLLGQNLIIMQILGSDIVSLEQYFTQIMDEDSDLKTFVLETSNNPFEMERFEALGRTDSFAYPALVLMMPVISGEDNGMHNFEAKQELAFAILYPTDGSFSEKLTNHKLAQLSAWRVLRRLRGDSRAGKFRLDTMGYKLAPFEYGMDNCVGQYVVLSLITSTNVLIGHG